MTMLEEWSKVKLYTVITNGLKVTIELSKVDKYKLPNGKIRPLHYNVEIDARREQGHIEGYYEFLIMGVKYEFDTHNEAVLFAERANRKLLMHGARTEFEHADYYVQDCHYHLWIDGVTDDREREHRAFMMEMKGSDYYREGE